MLRAVASSVELLDWLAELSGEVKEQALAAVREAFAPHVTEQGLNLGGATWLVTARAG